MGKTLYKEDSLKSIDVMKVKMVKETTLDYDYVETITCASDAYRIFEKFGLAEQAEEVICMICLNAKGKVIGLHEVSRGDATTSPVHPREIFKRALVNNAVSVIVAHNHPSGDPEPSSVDVLITERLQSAGRLLGIRLQNHIIVSPDDYYSFRGDGNVLDD